MGQTTPSPKMLGVLTCDGVVGTQLTAKENVDAKVNVEAMGMELMEGTIGEKTDMGGTTSARVCGKATIMGDVPIVEGRLQDALPCVSFLKNWKRKAREKSDHAVLPLCSPRGKRKTGTDIKLGKGTEKVKWIKGKWVYVAEDIPVLAVAGEQHRQQK